MSNIEKEEGKMVNAGHTGRGRKVLRRGWLKRNRRRGAQNEKVC